MTAIDRFLIQHSSDLLSWDRGMVVIESFYAKQFEHLGGNLNHLIALFEDYGDADQAAEDYSKTVASNPRMVDSTTAPS